MSSISVGIARESDDERRTFVSNKALEAKRATSFKVVSRDRAIASRSRAPRARALLLSPSSFDSTQFSSCSNSTYIAIRSSRDRAVRRVATGDGSRRQSARERCVRASLDRRTSCGPRRFSSRLPLFITSLRLHLTYLTLTITDVERTHIHDITSRIPLFLTSLRLHSTYCKSTITHVARRPKRPARRRANTLARDRSNRSDPIRSDRRHIASTSFTSRDRARWRSPNARRYSRRTPRARRRLERERRAWTRARATRTPMRTRGDARRERDTSSRSS